MSGDNRSSFHHENMKKYREIIGYSEPFPVVCEANFVKHVQENSKGKILPAVLEALLGGKVQIYSTYCIHIEVRSIFRAYGYHRHSIVKDCEHSRTDPEYHSDTCLKSFIENYPTRRLVVCCMKNSENYSMARGRILVTPDEHGGIEVASVAEDSMEIQIMEDFRKYFGFRPPFPTVCEFAFVRYVEDILNLNVNVALERLLCGGVRILSQADLPDLQSFVKGYNSRMLVICTMESRHHFAKVPGRIHVAPSDLTGQLEICTPAQESIVQHIDWFRTVVSTHSVLFKSLQRELLAKCSVLYFSREAINQKPITVNLGNSIFTLPSDVVDAMIKDSAMDLSASDSAQDLDVKFDLITDVHDTDPPVKILVKKMKIPLPKKGTKKRSRDDEALMSREGKKPKSSLEVQTSDALEAIGCLECQVKNLFRQFLLKQGFCEILAAQGGATSLGQQFYNQKAICRDLERVFSVAPGIKSDSSRTHTCVEIEMELEEDYSEVMTVLEALFFEVFEKLNGICQNELEAIMKQQPFKPLKFKSLRLTYEEGIQMLKEASVDVGPFRILDTELERRLGKLVLEKFGTDFYIMHQYPLAVRPFYTMPCSGDFSNSFDLFIRGEKIGSGSQRVHIPKLLESVSGVDVTTLSEYLEIIRYCAPPHGGFGAGLERVVMLFCGLTNYSKLHSSRVTHGD